MSHYGAPSLILGADAEGVNKYWGLLVEAGVGVVQIVGIQSNMGDLQPHILLCPNDRLVVVGFNSDVAAYSIREGALRFQFILDSAFASFYDPGDGGQFLAFHDFGVVALGWDGSKLWSFERDLITNVTFGDNFLHVTFDDAEPVTLDFHGRIQ
jgi:hypothetical protein